MKKNTVKFSCILLSCLSLGLNSLAVCADSARTVTIGADLSDAQKEKIFEFFNTDETQAVVIEVTNQDERKYLEGVVSDSIIGTHTYSCAYIEPTTEGGVFVKTANLDWVTAEMLGNALITAGIQNCNVLATAPFPVSGTGALTGVMMAYETATDTELDEDKKQLANEELVLTAELSDDEQTNDVLEAVNEIKQEVISDGITDKDSIFNIVVNVTNEHSLELTDEEISKLTALIEKFTELDYDKDSFTESLDNFKAQLTGEAVETAKEETKNWLQKVWEAIVNFFKKLFGNKDEVAENVKEGVSEASQKASDFFNNINTDVFSFDGEDTDVNDSENAEEIQETFEDTEEFQQTEDEFQQTFENTEVENPE
jgi:uncharacterized protein YpuA (DUF1002 family)